MEIGTIIFLIVIIGFYCLTGGLLMKSVKHAAQQEAADAEKEENANA